MEKSKKRTLFCRLLSLALVLLLTVPLMAFKTTGDTDPLGLTAWSAICMDYDTGEVFYEKDADSMRVPASMTKIMTAYIIHEELEKGSFTKDSLFRISDYARSISYDASYPLKVALNDDYISVDQALQNILIPSASGTCVVAAENISGSEAAFVQRMNQTAQKMGLKAQFYNSHGARVNYMSCRSVAVLTRKIIQRFPDVLTYTSMPYTMYNNYKWVNTNKLLSTYQYEGCDGFKTGTITESGYCLSATAVRNGRRIISVIMGATDNHTRHTDSIKVLDYGFEEAARRDANRENCKIELVNPYGQELRIGADVYFNVRFSNISTAFQTAFTLYNNGKKLGSYQCLAYDGAAVTVPIYLDESLAGSSSTVIDIQMDLVTDRRVSIELPISDAPVGCFRDTAYHWAEDLIEQAAAEGWINGYGDRLFKPNGTITRAEFITVLARAIGMEAAGTANYADTAGHWAEGIIAAMTQAGYVNGFEDGSFRPNARISRQDAAVILYRVYQPEAGEAVSFADSDKISQYAKAAVTALSSNGVLNGYQDGTFRPYQFLSRAECVKMIASIHDENK